MIEPKVMVFVGQFPPPVTGFSLVTARLRETLKNLYRLSAVDIGGTRGRGALVYHLSRIVRTGRAIAQILWARATAEDPIVYVACDGGLGISYAFALVLTTRCLGMRIYVHHHCYDYIDRSRILMRLLVGAGSGKAVHIVLSPEMAEALVARYGRPIKAVVLSNAAFVPQPTQKPDARPVEQRPFTIGLLANLDATKGLFAFLELLEAAAARGLPVYGLLAGPLSNAVDRTTFDAARTRLGDRLKWLGGVGGAKKQAFFEGIDLFVFPTTYAAEAQPMVLFEAQAAGVPAIAYDRGAIKRQVGDAGVVVPREADFVEIALAEIQSLQADPDRLNSLRSTTRERFAKEQADAARQAISLFDAPSASFNPGPAASVSKTTAAAH